MHLDAFIFFLPSIVIRLATYQERTLDGDVFGAFTLPSSALGGGQMDAHRHTFADQEVRDIRQRSNR